MKLSVLSKKLLCVSLFLCLTALLLSVYGQALDVRTIDLQILHVADSLLINESRWSRSDSKDCDTNTERLSLYCALHKASMSLTGDYDNDDPSWEEVRISIDIAMKGKMLRNRIAAYNALKTTSFKDVKDLLATTITRVQKKLLESKSGGKVR